MLQCPDKELYYMIGQQNNTTDDSSTPTRSRQSSTELTRQHFNMQRIIQSNEQIIFQQSRQITQLSMQLSQLTRSNTDLSRKLEILTELGSSEMAEEAVKQMSQKLLEKVSELEQNLVLAKIESATKESEILTAKHELKKMKTENKRKSLKIDDNEHDHLSKSKIVHMIDSQNRFKLDLKITAQSNVHSQSDVKQWTKYLDIIHPFKCLTLKKVKEKTKSLIKKFIPNELRCKAWPIYIHDHLAFSKTFYSQLTEISEAPQKVCHQIQKDIERSFPQNQLLNTDKNLLQNLQELLELFHCYRPDLSYVQGMTYPAAILLLVTTDKYKAFKCFCNLVIANEFTRNLYSFNIKKISLYCRTFDSLLEDTIPWLYEQLTDLNINTQIFLIEWFYTFFGRAFSLATVLKIWDMMVYHGQVIFFRTALAIFDLSQDQLKDKSYEVCINTIKSLNVKQSKLLDHITSSKLSSDKLETAMSKVANINRDNQDELL